MAFSRRISTNIALLALLLIAAADPAGYDYNYGGLKFSSKQVYSGQRTSLKLFNDSKHVSKSFNLKFNCQIYNQKYFGFVFRAVHVTAKTSTPLMHLLFIPVQGNSRKCSFEFHFFNTEKTIRFEIDTLQMNNLSFSIEALPGNNLVRIACNDSVQETSYTFPKDLNINFVFGLYGENTDVAPMIVQNLRLNLNNQTNYQWPLNELSGNIAHEKLNNEKSEVSNPIWMQDKHYYWEKVITLSSDPMAGIVMDKNNQLLFLCKDSLIICEPHRGNIRVILYNNIRPFDKDAFFAVYNPKDNIIVGYDFHFLKVNDGRKLYSLYDPVLNTWTMTDTAQELDQNHHHCIFWNNDTSKLVVFGGYSYFHYYNTFKAFDFKTGMWEEIRMRGDDIFPRTHASVNRNRYTGDYYVFGGFGNKEGFQSQEGKYFYDLYRINPATREVKELWNINSPGFDFVPRGTLIFRPDASLAYVLGSKPVEKSSLRLYEINLVKPGIKAVSDSIPVIFSDMSGNAFLFHNTIQNELYCVTRETKNQKYAAVTVYKLIFPPSEIVQAVASGSGKQRIYISLFILLFVVFSIIYLLRKKNGKTLITQKTDIPERFERKRKNAIWLLHEFRVFDRGGHDITYRFPTKLKHAFFVLFLENHFNKGVPSSEFSELLWPSLNKNQQKNNRGVVMNNLRKIFEDMDGVSICKEENSWKITFTEQVYIDFIEIHNLIGMPPNDRNNDAILDYFSVGNLLAHETWEYIDQFKDRYSSAAIDILLEMTRNAFHFRNYMKCIEISDVILNHYDFLSEPAMIYKIKSLHILKNSSKAMSEFNKFRLKYSESISKNYHFTFDDILKLPEHFENHLG